MPEKIVASVKKKQVILRLAVFNSDHKFYI